MGLQHSGPVPHRDAVTKVGALLQHECQFFTLTTQFPERIINCHTRLQVQDGGLRTCGRSCGGKEPNVQPDGGGDIGHSQPPIALIGRCG